LALRKVPGVTASAGSIIFNVLTVAVLTIYFLVGLPRGQAAATALLAGQRKHADRNVRILEESLGRIGRYVSGNIVISIIAPIAAAAKVVIREVWLVGRTTPTTPSRAASSIDTHPPEISSPAPGHALPSDGP
jgi:predicted PurR-regulated permease PerM